MTEYIFDVETDGLLEDLSKIHCLVLRDAATGNTFRCHTKKELECGLVELENADTIIGHNIIKFDIPAIQKVYPNFNPIGEVFDTLVASRLIWSDISKNHMIHRRKHPEFPGSLIGRHSLEAWGYVMGFQKGGFNKGDDTDWSKYTPEMIEYCERDVDITARLYEQILSKNYAKRALYLEHDFQKIVWEQEKHGFKFNVEAAQALYGRLQEHREKIRAKLLEIFPPIEEVMKTPAYWELSYSQKLYKFDRKGECETFRKSKGWKPKECQITKGPNKIKLHPFNPGSRLQIANRLIAKYKWKPRIFTEGGDPKVDDDIMKSLPYPEAAPLAEFLMVDKRIGQLAEGKKALLKLEKDGYIHGEVITNGAVTGRCTHNRPNVAQTPKVTIPYGQEFRELYTVPKGFSLVGYDASGLEIRCLAHYLALYDGGTYARHVLDGDIHSVNQKLAGLDTRDQAKTFFYALIYGAFDKKIGKIIGKGPKEGAELRARFFAKLPAFEALLIDIKSAARKKGFLWGLDRRQVPVRSMHSILNTVCQGAGALIMKQAAVYLNESLLSDGLVLNDDFAKVADIHDEGQLQVREGLEEIVGEAAVAALKRSGESFNIALPIDGEYKVGKTWAETH